MRKFLMPIVMFGLFPLVMLSAQNLDREAFLEAEARFLGGNYPFALERYDEFIRQWPDSLYTADARYRRAVSLYRLGRADEAYTAFETVERRYRSTKYLAYIPFWKGVIEYERGAFSAAADYFTRTLEKAPDGETRSQALLYMGKTETALEHYERALGFFEEYLESLVSAGKSIEEDTSVFLFMTGIYTRLGNPRGLTDLWERIKDATLDSPVREQLALGSAEAYLALGDSGKAIALFEELENSPRRNISISALQRLLEYEQRRGNEAGVSALIVKAEYVLRSDPEALGEFWLRAGADAFNDGRYDLAQSYFLRISAVRGAEGLPAEVPIYLAEIAYRRGEPQEAYRILSEAGAGSSGDKDLLYLRLGWYALGLGDWENARKHLTEALSLAEAAGQGVYADAARSYLAFALYRSDEYAEALSLLSGLSDPAAPFPGLLSAELNKKEGRTGAALESYNAVLAGDPASAEAHMGRLVLLFENKQYRRLLEAAAEMGRSVPDSALSAEQRFALYYMRGIASAVQGNYSGAVDLLDTAIALGRGSESLPWAEYYRGWALYRSSRFEEAAAAFTAFTRTYTNHAQAYSAAYLGAWSYSQLGNYRSAAELASRAAGLAAARPQDAVSAEDAARAYYLEGTLRPFFGDYTGAVGALDRAVAVQSPASNQGITSYTVKAAFEKGTVYFQAGQINEADGVFQALVRNFPNDPLAQEASFRRGELMFSAGRWADAAERFSSYRTQYPSGAHVDGALYFGGLAQGNLKNPDGAILLWERLLRDFSGSRYRFPTVFSLARAYRDKQDWQSSFNAYTSALAEFGDRARAAGADVEAETLRYMIARLPEKAARLHVKMDREHGTTTPAGRTAALELARFYMTESSQPEAGAALADEVIALRSGAPGAAAEAYLLKGDYLASLGNWGEASASYMEAVSSAAQASANERSTRGLSIRGDIAPEALFKAASAQMRLGQRSRAAEINSTLQRLYPNTDWARQGRRLLEDTP